VKAAAIVATAPLRLPLAGGGSDLPGSAIFPHLIATALDLRVSVAVRRQAEQSASRPPGRGLTDLFADRNPGYTALVTSQTPTSAGLGGSGALSVALVAAERHIRGNPLTDRSALAVEAWRWEREILGRPVGFQDQTAAAYGGCVEIIGRVGEDGAEVRCRDDLADALQTLADHHLLLVDTGRRRDAARILSDGNGGAVPAYRTEPDALARCLLDGEWREFAAILNRQWEEKRRTNPRVSSAEIDSVLDDLRAVGATGVKIVGAGGGGFALCCMPKHDRDELEQSLTDARRVHFRPYPTRIGAEVADNTIPDEETADVRPTP